MLSESFVASLLTSTASPAASSSALKDVGICTHEFQPNPSIRTTLKKSSTDSNCLAVTASHIFAAQAGKAVVQVYSRERGNQEATVPFPERIRSIAVAGGEDDGAAIIVLGTEGGRLILWEICTGRQVSTPAAHLQPITSLVVDPTHNFILSGSEDGSIHVWSLPGLISFSKPHSAGQNLSPSNSPIRTISNHSAAIASIAVGHSSNRNNIAISTSKDRTAIVWEYRTGKILRTFLLPGNPLCLAIDPADRAFFVGYDDGSTQLIDFFKNPSAQNVLYDADQQQTPSQLSAAGQWLPPSPDFGAVECLALSYDATSLLSGHRGGVVVSWDIAKGRFASTIITFNYPVTNLQMLPPTGLQKARQRIAVHNVVKPRYDPAFSNTQSLGDAVPTTYSFTAHLISSSSTNSSHPRDEFAVALSHQSFPSSLISEGLAELRAFRSDPLSASVTRDHNQTPPDEQLISDDHPRLSALEQEVQSLKRQLSIQESARHANMAEIVKLREYVTGLEDVNNDLLDKHERMQQLRLSRRVRREEKELKRREAWFEAEKRGKNGDVVMKEMEEEDDGEDITSGSDEMSSEN
ncbi:Pre-rRNA-processing protein ipi3 [Emydomyces testavorans]|uniref:Pre-rRNA-processing protein IPI3 n=1 Tax=Emydomyces testavorans TaxID=2070801 RepID=A0AAF0IH26_9EURO|nr:Pre-rRNA-processing protein ipi3 [Emydomyces testavorans]